MVGPLDGGQLGVGILGAGTMSPGIAAAFATHGHEVVVWARRPDRAREAVDTAGEQGDFLVANGLVPEAPGAARRLAATGSLADLAGADVVVEAISEDLEAKRDLLRELERVCRADAILATNTSGLRVTDIASGLDRPERVVAMHFWNPAHLMPLVEVAGGELGSEAAVDRAVAIARSIGKLPVVLRSEVLGFLGTRMQQAVVREAIGLLEAGVASAEDIDLAVRASFGIRFPVIGPLETTDLSGLDVIESIHRYLLADLDASSSPQAALRERVARGELGVKSGRGFHDWARRDASALQRRRDEELVRRLRLIRET
jgi:3-hydroxybutyryl-CoA dehydrogenase